MKGLACFLALGLYIVWLSTLEPETSRWFALALAPLGVAFVVSAVWRRPVRRSRVRRVR